MVDLWHTRLGDLGGHNRRRGSTIAMVMVAIVLTTACTANKATSTLGPRPSGESTPEQTVPGATASSPLIPPTVAATVETTPVPNADDAADDPAIWANPDDAARSLVIGTDKEGGLAVYDLSGRQLQYLPDGQMNNVDVRSGFGLAGSSVALVTAGDRSDNSIAIYRIAPATLKLVDVAARVIHPGITTYGSCMYRSAKTAKVYYFVDGEDGQVEQWELFDGGAGVDARRVRTFDVGSKTEGCVADDEAGSLYVGEEDVGIWRYGAEPDGGNQRTPVDSMSSGHLVADVEGLAIALGSSGSGYLIASSQGDNAFALYRREGDNPFIGRFRITAGPGIDGVEETDGIDVTTVSLGPLFPRGVLVAQDGSNDDGNQNFKFVPWDLVDVAA